MREMDEQYRMLGREHQADLEREAAKWRRGAELRASRPPSTAANPARGWNRRRSLLRATHIWIERGTS
jgi:hypothetical protein